MSAFTTTYREISCLRRPWAWIPALLLLCSAAVGAVPLRFGYQGAVFDSSGAPATGPVGVEVSIFDAELGGGELYHESHVGVTLLDGTFDIEVGGGTSQSGVLDPTTFSGDQTWLELTVDGEVMAPRQRLLAVPYALRAAVAETVLGGIASEDVSISGSGSQLGGTSLFVENTNSIDGVAAVLENQSSWETARFENKGYGEVMKLYGQGSGSADAVLRVENTRAGSGSYAATFTGKTRFDHTTSWSQSAVEIYGSGRWSGGPALRVENVRTDDTGIAGYFMAHSPQATLVSVNDGPGESLSVSGMGATADEAALRVGNSNADRGVAAFLRNESNYATAHLKNEGTGEVLFLQNSGTAGTGHGPGSQAFIAGVDANFDTKFWIDSTGMAHVRALEILGGADLSERFDVRTEEATPVVPGTVVSIDPKTPGQLVISGSAYDRTVAGVIAGAGGIAPGMLMNHEGTVADGEHPVALSGRVYVRADDSNGPIRPGDLLTTSETPGLAMRADDPTRSHGSVLGKAMSARDAETGLVLALINLQ